MTNPWFKPVCFISALLLVLVVFGNLGTYSLLHEEPRRALIALELLFSDSIWQPSIHGEPYFRKPPLYNWVIAFFYWLTGNTNEWVTRLPSALSFVLLGYWLYRFVAKHVNRTVGIYAAVIFICIPELLVYYSRLAEMDIFFSLITFPIIVLPWAYLKEGKKLHFLLIPPLFGAIGFLAKGFPSVAFLGVSMLCAIVIHKQYRFLYNPGILLAILAFAIPLLFYFLPIYQNGLWEAYIADLTHESFGRVVNKGFIDRIKVFFGLPLKILLVTLPFSIAFFIGFKKHISQPFIKAMLILLVANILPYLISPGARVRYIYPLFPLLAILFAFGFYQLKEGEWMVKVNRIGRPVLLGFCIVIMAGMIYFKVSWLVFWFALILVGLIAYFGVKTLKSKYQLLLLGLLLVSVARIVHDTVGSHVDVLSTQINYQEKQQGRDFVKIYGDRPIYFNPGAERYFSFSYEVTRLTERVMKRDLTFTDPQGVYIIREKNKPINMSLLEHLVIGNDSNFILVAHGKSEE